MYNLIPKLFKHIYNLETITIPFTITLTHYYTTTIITLILLLLVN